MSWESDKKPFIMMKSMWSNGWRLLLHKKESNETSSIIIHPRINSEKRKFHKGKVQSHLCMKWGDFHFLFIILSNSFWCTFFLCMIFASLAFLFFLLLLYYFHFFLLAPKERRKFTDKIKGEHFFKQQIHKNWQVVEQN